MILDEAHQLPDTATLFFGEQVTAGQLAELARDAEVAARDRRARSDGPSRRRRRHRPRDPQAAPDARRHAGKARATRRGGASGFTAELDALAAALDRLTAELALTAERSEELDNCARRATEAAATLARWIGGLDEDADAADDGVPAWIRWVDVTAQGWQLHASPLSIADMFAKQVTDSGRAWIFTSATLAVGRDFSLYQRDLGLADARTGSWDSPFDYGAQALLYVPRDLPQPNSREHTEAVIAAALPVLKASGGRAFLLFTTLRALDIARDLLSAAIAREGLRWPLLVQGDGSRSELLSRFRELGNAVLLGSASFREGVDVPGDALSVVVLDKLPFAPPDDPLLAARLEHLACRGRQPVLRSSGAAGGDRAEAGRRPSDPHRIRPRRTDDLRPAAHRQAYGRRIWRSLPPMRRTRETRGSGGVLARRI